MKRNLFFAATLLSGALLSVPFVHAKVWRVNNTPGVNADFNTLVTAAATAVAGDTLYIEASTVSYNLNQSKRLVMIGPGYFVSGTAGNAGLQANPNTATVGINVDSAGSGSQYIGLTLSSLNPTAGADDIKVSRCHVGSIGTFNTGTYANWKIAQCYLVNLNMIYPAVNWEITNNIVTSVFGLSTGQNCLVRNNVFRNVGVNINSTYFSNNMLLNSSFIHVNSTIKYNIATLNVLPQGNNNQNNIAQNTLIVEAGSTDGYYQLKAGSPAIGAGEPIGGVTPDAGPFGTVAPYRLSGIPSIPTIYNLTMPASIPSNATTLPVMLSTRSNN